MHVEIIGQDKQPLLGRTVIQATVAFEGVTPTRKDVRKAVAKAAKLNEDNLIIKTITTGFGGQQANIEAAHYEKLEDAKALEHKSLMAKHEKPQEEQKEEAPAAEPQEEKSDEA